MQQNITLSLITDANSEYFGYDDCWSGAGGALAGFSCRSDENRLSTNVLADCLAAGLDKNGAYIDALANLGFGFIEVGTITPKPQAGNDKPRLFRIKEAGAIINRMGFNNAGVNALIQNIKRAKFKGVLGINIGKNALTPVENALDDYVYCLERVYP